MEMEIPRRAHLVGIAGAGMSSLARVLVDWGWPVTGSDATRPPEKGTGAFCAEHPAGLSGKMRLSPFPADAELLIHTDAVGPENPEIREAAGRGIPVLSYFEALGRLSAGRRTLAVAGTHGKSTTAAMLGAILVEAGLDPTVVVGAVPVGASSGGRAGRGPWMVVEACEYRANFLKLRPEAAAILNVEPDHFDFYRSPEQLDRAFADFARSVPPDGLLVVGRDSPRAMAAASTARGRVETFGADTQSDWTAAAVAPQRGYYRFELVHGGRSLGQLLLRVPGRHNVLNALAAAALASNAGVPGEAVVSGLGRFQGLQRRLQPRGTWRGVALVDDYAHHPTEVRAALQTVREMYPASRLWCVFQPHQASRTKALLDELAASLDNTDMTLVADIFRAREPSDGPSEVTAADLARGVRRRGRSAAAIHSPEEIAAHLRAELRPGDVLLVLGAGDIGGLHGFLTEMMERP